MVEFLIWRDTGQVKSVVNLQNQRKVNFWLFTELVDGTFCGTALRDTGAEETWQLFKDFFRRAHRLPCARHQAREAGNQHGCVGTSWSKNTQVVDAETRTVVGVWGYCPGAGAEFGEGCEEE